MIKGFVQILLSEDKCDTLTFFVFTDNFMCELKNIDETDMDGVK